MSYFLSETYDKPKLVENKLIKKIILQQKSEISLEEKFLNIFTNFIYENYKIIIVILIILYALYWRYCETNKKKQKIKKYNKTIYESDSDDELETYSDSEDL